MTVMLASCGFMGSGLPVQDVQPVDFEKPVRQVLIGDGLLLVDIGLEDERSRTVTKFDTGQMTVVAGGTFSNGGANFLHNGEVWRRELEPRAGVPRVGPNRDDFGEVYVKLDIDNQRIESQVPTGTAGIRREVFQGDHVWAAGLAIWKVDLTTGEVEPGPIRGVEPANQLAMYEDYLWLVDVSGIVRIDPDSLDHALLVDFDRRIEPEFASVIFWDGRYWVSGAVKGESELAYELDLDQGELINPVDADRIPTRHFEADGQRWELYNSDWHDQWPILPLEEDVWRQIDIATGEILGEFDFGEYTPITVQDDSLWLQTTGVLGHIPLDQLTTDS